MTLTRARIIAACAVVAAIVVVIAIVVREEPARPPEEEAAMEELGEGARSVVLAFASYGAARIVEERREIVVTDEATENAARILQELAKGPAGEGAVRTIPYGTEVLRVFFDDSGGVFVDFSREFVDNHPGGSTGELFTIRSIVRTLAANFPDLERVSVLVEGEEIETIAGHIDASVPFLVEEYR